MDVIVDQTKLCGVLLIRPQVFQDERGFFLESWNRDRFNKVVGRTIDFVQDNYLRSVKGVLRGLHYQVEPVAQGKLISVMRGEIYDVAVDIRPGSPTYGQWIGAILTGEARETLWIPQGFAHGFLVLSDHADVLYKTTSFYSPSHERCIAWNDLGLGIEWPLQGRAPIVSAKDQSGAQLGAIRP
jgi:dTDP-4-dehydrorhamnose 3,5-epimerase